MRVLLSVVSAVAEYCCNLFSKDYIIITLVKTKTFSNVPTPHTLLTLTYLNSARLSHAKTLEETTCRHHPMPLFQSTYAHLTEGKGGIYIHFSARRHKSSGSFSSFLRTILKISILSLLSFLINC